MFNGLRTLSDLFAGRKESAGGIRFFKTEQDGEAVSYYELYKRATSILSALQYRQVSPRSELIIYLDDPACFLAAFHGAILGGIIPVPLSVGRTYEQNQKLFLVHAQLHRPHILTSRSTWEKLQKTLPPEQLELAQSFVPVFIEEALPHSGDTILHHADEDEVAYVQFSSGSTSSPKGVALTHRNILTNCKAILANIASPPEGDLFFSWMPLTHDMGLIGYHLAPMLAGWDHYLMSTELFIRKPALWLELLSQYKITFTASPNFGYTCVLKYLHNYSLPPIDLSSVRIITNGAEPISAALCRTFEKEMEVYGLRKNTIFPVYGLAEASLAVTFSEPGAVVRSVVIDRACTGEKEQVREDATGAEFVNVGKPLAGNCRVRLVAGGKVLKTENVIGHIQIKGDNVTTGYYNNPAATAEAITPDGWLRTGDLGFTREGALFITGRAKDIFFVNGQNFYPHDIESVLEQHPQLRPGRIAVAGTFNSDLARDEVLLFIRRTGKASAQDALADELRTMMNAKFGIAPDVVVPVKEIPKTTSGKVQRYKLVSQYLQSRNTVARTGNETPVKEAMPAASESPTRENLIRIWKNTVRPAAIGIDDDFFAFGGTSLLAAEMLGRVSDELGKEISLADFYTHTTVAKLAALIDSRQAIPRSGNEPTISQHAYALSSDQERLYYHWELDRQSVAYNIPVAIELTGQLDLQLLKTALNRALQRHVIFSAVVERQDEELQFNIGKHHPVDLSCEEANRPTIADLLKASVQPFHLAEGPLYRFRLFRSGVEQYILFADFHHIIADGYSLAVFFNELSRLYNGESLQPAASYQDQLSWLNGQRQDAHMQAMASFWQQHHGEAIPRMNLPLDFARPAVFSQQGKKEWFPLDASLKEAVIQFARVNGVTPFMVYLGAFNLLLSKISGQADVVTGLAVSMREPAGNRQSAGMFTNSLAFCSHLKGEQTIGQFLQALRSDLLQAMAAKTYPFLEVIRRFAKEHDPGRNPVFDTMFVYQDFDLVPSATDAISWKKFFFDPGFSKYDLSIELFAHEPGFYIEYATDLFSERTIHCFARYYTTILQGLCSSVAAPVSTISLLTAGEKDDFLSRYNDTAAAYPSASTITALIAEQLHRHPEQVAIRDGAESISYAMLDQQASGMAAALREKGVVSNDPVAILLERSAAFVVAALAVLKAGGCFVPLDTTSPASRISYILEDCQAKVLITDAALQQSFSLPAEQPVLLIGEERNMGPVDECLTASPANTAYIIYTSGTTGRPKGVVVTHRSLVNYIHWSVRQYVGTGKPGFAFYTSVAFDLTITSLFVPLVTGGTVIAFREDADNLPVQQLVKDPEVTLFKATPSHLRLLAAGNEPAGYLSDSRINCIIVGGEALTTSLARQIHDLFGGHAKIFNEYGPTEATVGCMTHLYDPDHDQATAVPIGVPIDNAEIFLLDASLQPVPYQVQGELYIAGDCLAQGYLHQPGLTADKFIPHLWRVGKKMYRTGDYARRLYSGLLEYGGRIDQQVKLKGYRIELEEIEQALDAQPGVKESVVVVRNAGQGDAYLAAYIVPATGEPVPESRLRKSLQELLPAYSLPRVYTIVPSIPLTANGKLDERALPEPVFAATPVSSLVVSNPLGAHIAAAWKEVLKVTQVSMTDNFYWLGGDSIKAVQIASRLRDAGIGISAREILLHPVIEELCERGHFTGPVLSGQEDARGARALSPIEHWFFSQRLSNPNYFNQTLVVRCKRKLNPDLVGQSLRLLVDHHDGLRLRYDQTEDRMWIGDLYPGSELQVQSIALNSEDEWIETGTVLKSGFDLSHGPLINMAVIHEEGCDHLFITAHHLVIDGFSWRILLEDFNRLYTGLESGTAPLLSFKTASLREWQHSLNRLANDPMLQDEESGFWNAMSEPVAGIPFDMIVVPPSNRFSTHTLVPGSDLSAALLAASAGISSASAETILVAALVKVLKAWSGSKLVKIELEHHGRDVADVDVSRTVGWFTSLYPLLLGLESDQPAEQLQEIKEQLHKVPRKGMGYGILKYMTDRLQDRSPKTTVRFNYLGRFDEELDNDLFVYENKFTGYESDLQNAPTCPVELNCYCIQEQFRFEVIYDTHCFLPQTMEWMMQEYHDALLELLSANAPDEHKPFSLADLDTCELDEGDLEHLFS